MGWFDDDLHLEHYGMPRRSGRYPWGSGEHPFQSAEEFMGYIKAAKEEGFSESQIARDLGLSTSVFKQQRTAARNEIRASQRAMALKLTSQGYSVNGAASRMGLPAQSVRNLLSDSSKSREELNQSISDEFDRMIKAGYYVDIGEGAEAHLGISKEKLSAAVRTAENKGYHVVKIYQKQVGTHNKTSLKVLAPADADMMTVIRNKDKIAPPNFQIDRDTNDVVKIEKPRSYPSSKVEIRYAEEGGIDRDGLIQLRRGIPELSLGNAKYAQVRIAIDGTHYLKGMAVYADDLPDGIDIRYNVNKHKGTPKLDTMKKIKSDPANPFGATIRMDDELILTQRHYVDKDGTRQQSCLNVVNEEGAWFEWSKSLPSQMLSKQRVPIIQRQLEKSYQATAARVTKLKQMRNPHIRAKLAEDLAGQIDFDADNLRAAAYPRQCAQVILPFPELSENEIYAPNFKDGERVALIRFPHGGIFEIPQLTVRNHGSPAAKTIGNAIDAVGINPRVAEQLSGADFDGDTVLVIPNNDGTIVSHAKLKELEGFDPKEAYPGTDCDPKDLIPNDGPDKKKGDKLKGLEMGKISNLITDMSIAGAPFSEIARAVKHSMVVIDAQKHQLNYKQSYIDNNIEELFVKYHGGANKGASTVVSRATADLRVPEIKEVTREYEVPEDRKKDWIEGKRIFVPTGGTHWDKKTGKAVDNLMTVNKMSQHENAEDLRGIEDRTTTGYQVESAYINFSNRMKELANECRRMTRIAPEYRQRVDLEPRYRDHIAVIKSKIADRKKKAPFERRAQILAEADLQLKIAQDSSIATDPASYKKEANASLVRARAKLAIPDVDIHLTNEEWEAVFSGALNKDAFDYLMRHCDTSELNKFAYHETDDIVSDRRVVMVKEMDRLGYSRSQICEHLSLSPRAIKDILE